MSQLIAILNKHYNSDESFDAPDYKTLWNEVSGYIGQLERKTFKTNNKQQYEAHTERVLAFHDFVRLYAKPRGKSIEWALAVFRRRFTDVETTLTIRRKMNIEIPGAEVGFLNAFVRFVREYLTAKRACQNVSPSCIEETYFKAKRFSGKRARAFYKSQVEHHFELINRTIVALSYEELFLTELNEQ